MPLNSKPSRSPATARFLLGAIYFVFVEAFLRWLCHHIFDQDYAEGVYQASRCVLFLVGFVWIAKGIDGQRDPAAYIGIKHQPESGRQFFLGLAIGWGVSLAAVLAIVVAGRLAPSMQFSGRNILLVGYSLLLLLTISLADQIVFRGYPFQRLVEAVGPTLAVLLFALLSGLHALFGSARGIANPRYAFLGSALSTILLSVGYLRTRSLWLPWGLQFAVTATLGVLFGLPVAGNSRYSTLLQSEAHGPDWLTGSFFGPLGGALYVAALVAALFFLMRVTRDYAFPVLIPGGIPVDIDAGRRPSSPPPPAAILAATVAATAANQPPPLPGGLIQIAPALSTLPGAKEMAPSRIEAKDPESKDSADIFRN